MNALPAGEPPPGARGFDAATVGALMIALGQSAEGLRLVVSAIKGWLRRGGGKGRKVRLELGGDALELSQASTARSGTADRDVPPQAHDRGGCVVSGQRKALIIANDTYEQEALRNLLAPGADAEALGRVLGDAQIGDFAVEVVRMSLLTLLRGRSRIFFRKADPTMCCCCISPVTG